MARWDPDKRWLLAVETLSLLKQQGWQPLLLARGGVEAHGAEVLRAAAMAGLRVAERTAGPGVRGFLDTLDALDTIGFVGLRTPLDAASRRVLFQGADAVLANSGHERLG